MRLEVARLTTELAAAKETIGELELARMRETDERLREQAELTAARKLLEKAREILMEAPELNHSNYTYDDVCWLDTAVCEVCSLLEPTAAVAAAEEAQSRESGKEGL